MLKRWVTASQKTNPMDKEMAIKDIPRQFFLRREAGFVGVR
jgi:hypothetical protein